MVIQVQLPFGADQKRIKDGIGRWEWWERGVTALRTVLVVFNQGKKTDGNGCPYPFRFFSVIAFRSVHIPYQATVPIGRSGQAKDC